MAVTFTKALQGILNLLSVDIRQHRKTHTLLREIKSTMSTELDQLKTVFDNIQTTVTNAMSHQELAFSDLESKITNTEMSDADKQAILAITARAQGFNTDLQNMDAAAVAADPGPAVVTLPGTPDPVTPPTLPSDPTGGSASPSSATSSDSQSSGDSSPAPGTSATGVTPPGDTSGTPVATAGSEPTTAPQPGTDATPNDVAQNAPEATLAPAPLNPDGTVVGSDQQTANPNGVNPGGTAAQGGSAVSGGGSANPNELNNADPTTGNADRTPAMPNPDGSAGAPLTKAQDLATAGTQPGDVPAVVAGS